MSSLWRRLKGTIESAFQIGLGGPIVKNNSGSLDARTSGDSAYVNIRALNPVLDQDVATKLYVDENSWKTTAVNGQFNGGNSLPSNTSTEQFFVVTTTGGTASIGQLIWDDGSNAGSTQILTATGRQIVTQLALTGGTATFKADSLYVWDTGSSAWVNAGGSTVSGAERLLRYAITNAGTQDSAATLPANAVVRDCVVEITTPYSGGATIEVGQSGSLTLLQDTTMNGATVAGMYGNEQDTAWGGSALAVRTTVLGSPAAGAGFVMVRYSLPDA